MGSVSLRDVRKSFGAVDVIQGIDLEVDDGEFLVFVGPSGCGKSTMLRMIAGLEAIDGGDLLIDGQRANDIRPADRGAAMVFQNYALYPHMTVAENMGFALKMAGVGRQERDAQVRRAADVLRIVDLLGRLPRELSGGQRQRVAIGRAIVRKPRVFLFDEPLSNLDAALRVNMRIELSRLHRELGTTMIYVTHDQVEAMTMGTRIAVFNHGRIEQLGAPLALYNAPANEFVAGFLGASNFLDGVLLARDPTGAIVETAAGRIRATVDGAEIGSKVRIAVRPERVLVASDTADGLPARIRDIVYRGPVTHLYMDSAAGSLLSYQQNAGTPTWQVGDEVRCAWEAHSGVAVVPERA